MQKHSKSFVEQSAQVARKLLERYDSYELSRLEVLVAVRAHLSAHGYNPTTAALGSFFEVGSRKIHYHLSALARDGLIVTVEADKGHPYVVLLTGRGLLVLDELTGKTWQSSRNGRATQ